MDYPFTLPDRSGLNLALRPARYLSGLKILKDGVPLKRSMGIYTVPMANGTSLYLKLRVNLNLYNTPQIEYRDHVIDVLPALSGFWGFWGGGPFLLLGFVGHLVDWEHSPRLLLFLGFVLFGICFGIANTATFAVLRSHMSAHARCALALIITPLALVTFATVINLVHKLM